MVTNKKIYVSLASYRDPFLQSTIDSLFETADNPKQIKVGCFIHALKDELEELTLKNIHEGKVKFSIELAGSMFSVTECRNRSLAWIDETFDYVLQVDAHTRFDKGWDSYLISLIESIEYSKPILSGSLSVFDILDGNIEKKTYLHGARSFYLDNEDTRKSFLNSYDLSPRGIALTTEPNQTYIQDWYMAGHFIFAPAKYFTSIPQPDWVLFWGEEIINGVRAFTAGWNVYIPVDIPLYHLFSPVIKRPRLWEDFPDNYFPLRDITTDRIINILMSLEVREGDLFYERSLQEFYDYIKVDLGQLFHSWRLFRQLAISEGRQNELH